MPERLGLGVIPGTGWRADEIRTVAREAEEAGFDAIFSAEVNNDALATVQLMGEATERIKADFPDTAVIGLSVQREEDIIEQMRAAGIASYVTKGSSFDTLRLAIEEAASSHGRSRV